MTFRSGLTIKKGKTTSKYAGEVIPSPLVIAKFFSSEYHQIAQLDAEVTRLAERKEEFEAEHASDEGALNGLEGKGGITKGNVQLRVVELKEAILIDYTEGSPEHERAKSITKTKFGTDNWIKNIRDKEGLFAELDILYDYLRQMTQETIQKTAHKQKMELMHESVIAKYNQLTEEEIKTLVIEDKWFARIRSDIHDEVQRITHQLTGRVKQLDERYARPLPKLERDVDEYSVKVEGHLKKMGLSL